jgi:hypothetical protein
MKKQKLLSMKKSQLLKDVKDKDDAAAIDTATDESFKRNDENL